MQGTDRILKSIRLDRVNVIIVPNHFIPADSTPLIDDILKGKR